MTGLILVFVVGEVGRQRRLVAGTWLGRLHLWVDGSAMAIPHGERSELTLIGSVEPLLLLEILTALPMLGRSSTVTILVASFAGALLASRPGPLGAQGATSTAAWAT